MNKTYSYKEYSDSALFSDFEGRTQLREYKENLVFYDSCNTNLNAEYGYGNKTPIVSGDIENLSNGPFGQYIYNQGSLTFDKENFSLFNKEGCLKFRLGTSIEKVYGYQKILLTDTFTLIAGIYSFNLKVGREDIKEVSFTLSPTMKKIDIVNTILTEVYPSKYKASLDVSDLANICIISEYVGDAISITSGTTGIDFLSIFSVDEPKMPNTPSTATSFLSFENGIDNKGKINFIHYADTVLNRSMVKVDFYNNSGTLTSTLMTEFNNDINEFYSFELDFNSEIAYLFLEGKLADFKKTGFSRLNNDCNLIINSGGSAFPYNFDEIILYSKVINNSSYTVETVPLTKYSTKIPYIDYCFSSGFTQSTIDQIFINATNNISFIIFSNESPYYYLSGSWRLSDGTYSMSSDRSTFEIKITNFPFKDTDQIKVRAFFESDGVEEAYIDNIYFIANDVDNGDKDAIPATLLGSVHIDTSIDLTGKDLTIKTDQGVTTINLSALPDITKATAQNIIDLINDSDIPGIDKASYNSFNQIYLTGKLRGSKALITVSGSGAVSIFGSETTAIGEDPLREVIDYSILFDYVKGRLGYPTVPVELTNKQMEDILSDAVNLYNKWRNYSQKLLYVSLSPGEGDGYDIPAIIGSERNIVDIIFKPRTPFGIYDSNNFENNIFIQQLFNKYGSGGARSGFLTDYSISINFIADSNLVLGTEPRYDIINRKIFVYPRVKSDQFKVGIKYKGQLSIDECMNDSMLKNYMVGACKKLIGTIRNTFGGTINAGETTLQMTGNDMIAAGDQEMKDAIAEMKGEGEPLSFLIG